MDEQPRTGTNSDDAFTLTADDALKMYEQAGHPRTLRSIQKFCKRGDIECRFEQTLYGRGYPISPLSVERHVRELDEIAIANSLDELRTDASVRTFELSHTNTGDDTANSNEPSRPDAPDTKYVALLERENDFLRDQIWRKDHQIEQRDNQIQSMIERDRETNFLILRDYTACCDSDRGRVPIRITIELHTCGDDLPYWGAFFSTVDTSAVATDLV